MKHCAYCSELFMPTVTRQIYCSVGCREAATKDRSATKRRTRKKNRTCANKGCNNKLSIYNDSNYCSSCFFSERAVEQELREIKRRANAKGSE